MNYEPKTEQQAQEEGLMPAGVYDFEVLNADDGVSQKGNDMITVKLGVINADGQERKVTDYLLEAMALKLRHFAYATGCGTIYESGSLTAEDIRGRTGKCKLIIQPAKDGYPAKNTVADYLTPLGNGSDQLHRPLGSDPRPAPPPLLDDDIPF